MKRWLSLIAGIVLGVVVGIVVVNFIITGDVETPDQVILPSEPPPPPDHDAEQARGLDEDGNPLQRGAQVGATPSKLYPRPVDRGFKYSYIQSPNWSSRGMNPPEAIVVHVFGSGTCAGLKSWFQNPAAQVSAHFGVCKNGEIIQFVELADAAWHCGIWNRPALSQPRIAYWFENGINCNLRTVGIEVDLRPGETLDQYPEMQTTFDALVKWNLEILGLEPERWNIIAHAEIDSVNRAVDPWCCIDINQTAAYLKSIMQPAEPTPIELTLESLNERLQEIERRLGIGQ